jgi:hypothetical protein
MKHALILVDPSQIVIVKISKNFHYETRRNFDFRFNVDATNSHHSPKCEFLYLLQVMCKSSKIN